MVAAPHAFKGWLQVFNPTGPSVGGAVVDIKDVILGGLPNSSLQLASLIQVAIIDKFGYISKAPDARLSLWVAGSEMSFKLRTGWDSGKPVYTTQKHLVGDWRALAALYYACVVGNVKTLYHVGMLAGGDQFNWSNITQKWGTHRNGTSIDVTDLDTGKKVITGLQVFARNFGWCSFLDGLYYEWKDGQKPKHVSTCKGVHKNDHYHIDLPRVPEIDLRRLVEIREAK